MTAPAVENGVNGAVQTDYLAGTKHPASFLDSSFANDNLAAILKTTDKLRDLGIDRHYPLPQIIVCGAQSSGKSSVLEAITEIPFPRSEKTCTKYVTKVTLTNSPTDSVKLRIQPDPDRPQDEIENLKAFKRSSRGRDWREFIAKFIEEANAAIFSKTGSAAGTDITRDVLLINISGPQKQPLQVLDLPGLIAYDQKEGGNKKEVTEDIVRGYMGMSQSIILAVIKATDDLSNAGILDFCKNYDTQGERTLGVITRPDVAEASQCESLIQVVLGRDPEFRFKHSWHVVRNRTTEEIKGNTAPYERDRTEATFFQESVWSKVLPQDRGIDSLRARIRQILLAVNQRELPELRKILLRRRTYLQEKFGEMGGDEFSDGELEKAFQDATRRLHNASRDHSRGIYESDIRKPESCSPVYLRARVVEQDEVFRDKMNDSGHAWKTQVRPTPIDPDGDLGSIYKPSDHDSSQRTHPADRSLKEDVAEVVRILNEKRGVALPTFFDPARIGDLFWKMSEGWRDIADEHLGNVYGCCEGYFEAVTPVIFGKKEAGGKPNGFANGQKVGGRLVTAYIGPQLETSKAAAEAELMRLEEDRLSFCKNFDLRFLRDRRAHSNRQDFGRAMAARQAAKSGPSRAAQEELEPSTYAKHAGRFSQLEQVEEVAETYLDAMWSHYLVARDQFIANVLMQVTERHLLRNIASVVPENLDLVKIQQLVREDDQVGIEKGKIKREIGKLDRAIDELKELDMTTRGA